MNIKQYIIATMMLMAFAVIANDALPPYVGDARSTKQATAKVVVAEELVIPDIEIPSIGIDEMVVNPSMFPLSNLKPSRSRIFKKMLMLQVNSLKPSMSL